jgi:hypothetical protein
MNTISKEEIQNEKLLASLKSYIDLNLNVDDIKITPQEEFLSRRFGDLEGDPTSLVYYDSYNK